METTAQTIEYADKSTEKPASIPNGSAWAAILAAAFGCAAFGALADLTEASTFYKKKLEFYGPTGDLSGKSTLAVVAWLVVWFLLHRLWRNRAIRYSAPIAGLAILLILASLAATFPPVFEIISSRFNK